MSKTIAEHLETLGVTGAGFFAGCSSLHDEIQRIKQAYRSKLLKAHPDKGGSSEAFHQVQAAYEYITALHENGNVIYFILFFTHPGNWLYAPRQYGCNGECCNAECLQYSPQVCYTFSSGDYAYYNAAIPFGIEGGEKLLVVIAGGEYLLTVPPNASPNDVISFCVLQNEVAMDLARIELALEEARVINRNKERIRRDYDERKKQKLAARISAFTSNGSWRSALAAGELDKELNDVLKGILRHIGLNTSGAKAVMIEKLQGYVAREKKEDDGNYPKKGNKRKSIGSEAISSKSKSRKAFGDVKNFLAQAL